MTHIQRIGEALMGGRNDEVAALTREALDGGACAEDLMAGGLIAPMGVIGDRFRRREIYLPDVLLAARAMQAGIDVLRPSLEGGEVPHRGTVILGTVAGDIHDIGKNLVGILLRGSGCRVVDLGHNVSAAAFVEAAREHGADIVGMSALLTTTMPAMAGVVSALKEAGLGSTKVMVGGAPVSEEFATRIGADGYGADAASAVALADRWLA